MGPRPPLPAAPPTPGGARDRGLPGGGQPQPRARRRPRPPGHCPHAPEELCPCAFLRRGGCADAGAASLQAGAAACSHLGRCGVELGRQTPPRKVLIRQPGARNPQTLTCLCAGSSQAPCKVGNCPSPDDAGGNVVCVEDAKILRLKVTRRHHLDRA